MGKIVGEFAKEENQPLPLFMPFTQANNSIKHKDMGKMLGNLDQEVEEFTGEDQPISVLDPSYTRVNDVLKQRRELFLRASGLVK